MDHLLSCDEADVLLAAAAVGALDPEDEHRVRRHLRGCAECAAAAAGYRRATDLLPLAVDLVEPPPALRARILATVYAEAAGAAGPVQPRRPWVSRLWERVPSGRAFSAAGMLGTAVATLVAGVSIWEWRGAGSTPAPATLSVSACGLTAQPGACGTLTYDSRTHQAILTVRGLDRIPVVDNHPTASYEVWLITPDRHTQAAAFLTLQPDGVTWVAAMEGDMSRYVEVATTREPGGGSSTPTGSEVLRLTLPPTTTAV